MRVKDLADIIAELPQDQTVQVVVEDMQGKPRYGKEFIATKTDAYGIREIVFATNPNAP